MSIIDIAHTLLSGTVLTSGNFSHPEAEGASRGISDFDTTVLGGLGVIGFALPPRNLQIFLSRYLTPWCVCV